MNNIGDSFTYNFRISQKLLIIVLDTDGGRYGKDNCWKVIIIGKSTTIMFYDPYANRHNVSKYISYD